MHAELNFRHFREAESNLMYIRLFRLLEYRLDTFFSFFLLPLLVLNCSHKFAPCNREAEETKRK